MSFDSETVEAHLSCGLRVGRAVTAAGLTTGEGVALLRAVAEELYPGAYETRALTPEEAMRVADTIQARLRRAAGRFP